MRVELLAVVLACVVVGCAKNPGKMWDELQTRLEPDYRLYFTGNAQEQVRGMTAVIQQLESADPRIWGTRDRESILAIEYGRLSLAEARDRSADLAREYWSKAVRAHRRRREWSDKYQRMLLVTPTPTEEAAGTQLAAMIKALDSAIAKSDWAQGANKAADRMPGTSAPRENGGR